MDEGTPISMILDTIVSVMIRCVKRLLRLNFVGKTGEKIFVENNQKNSFFANDKKVVGRYLSVATTITKYFYEDNHFWFLVEIY